MYANTIFFATRTTSIPALPGYSVREVNSFEEVLEGQGAALVVDTALPSPLGIMLIAQVKHHYHTAHIPVIALVSDNTPAMVQEALHAGVDDWVSMPSLHATLPDRIALCLVRKQRDVGANPLTLLPGNRRINAELIERMDSGGVAILYCDIDNFKAYNDRYGFYAGDVVLKSVASLLSAQLEAGDHTGFLGHIGGDDFVLICAPRHAQALAEGICSVFDTQAAQFYNEVDNARGKIVSLGRDGTIQEFPLMALSIAIVAGSKKETSPSQVGLLATRMKRRAKIKEPDGTKSTYVLYQEVPLSP